MYFEHRSLNFVWLTEVVAPVFASFLDFFETLMRAAVHKQAASRAYHAMSTSFQLMGFPICGG